MFLLHHSSQVSVDLGWFTADKNVAADPLETVFQMARVLILSDEISPFPRNSRHELRIFFDLSPEKSVGHHFFGKKVSG